MKAVESALRSAIISRWQWRNSDDIWTDYSIEDAHLLESSFCVKDMIILSGTEDRIINLRAFTQTHPRTGVEYNIRRLIMDEDITENRWNASEVFDGRTVFLNRPHDRKRPSAEDLSFERIVGAKEDAESVFLSSFGTDIEWLLPHFLVGTPITLIDQPPEGQYLPSLFPLGDEWPQFQLIHPSFPREKGGLFEHGTMHTKLIIIKRKNGKGLRIVISSANLIKFDWSEITQTFWIIDVLKGLGTEMGNLSSFGSDLTEYVSKLVDGNKLATDWISIMHEWSSSINYCVPQNVHLVGSVPGIFSGTSKGKYGQLRLREIISKLDCPTQPSEVLYQASSVGMLQKPFLESFIASVGSNESLFKLVWPEYSEAMSIKGNDHMFMAHKNAITAKNFLTPLKQLEGRSDMLNHSKIIVSPNYVYMGSHNFSMSAWGKLIYEGSALQIASYELGILITEPDRHGFTINYPFIHSEPTPMSDEPWTLDMFRRRIGCATEQLSEEDKKSVPISLGDFLTSKSRKNGKPILVYFHMTESHQDLLNSVRDSVELYPVILSQSVSQKKSELYTYHLMAIMGVQTVPAIVVLEGGSSLSNGGLRISGKFEGSDKLDLLSINDLLSSHQDDDIVDIVSKASTEEEENSPGEDCPLSCAVKFVQENGFVLLCIDLDGTIVEDNQSAVILPYFADFIRRLDPIQVKIALVTNQGGVGLKHWMTVSRFGEPDKLPSQEDVLERIGSIERKLRELWAGDLTIFIAFRFLSKGGKWGPIPFNSKTDPRWNQDWRKPGGGMIREAMKWAKISPFESSKVLMIGDMDTDEGAAKSANVRFQRAPNFFTGQDKIQF